MASELERALFGEVNAAAIRSQLDDFCRRHLGVGIRSVTFHRISVASVRGVMLDDGSRAVIKVHRPEFAHRLEAVQTIQRHLAGSSFPCPRPLAGPAPIGNGVATIESMLEAGSMGDAHEPVVRQLLAQGLRELVSDCQPLVGSVDPGPFWLLAGDQQWPIPHDVRFDFARTAPGAEWIDRLAAEARDRLRSAAGRMVIGHVDWRVENLRIEKEAITAVYDWESLRLLPEPVLVGAVAHAFTASWDATSPFEIPTLAESAAFIADYERARGAPFDARELDAADAAHVYTLAYGARCQHSDAVLKIFGEASEEDGYISHLRERARRA